MKKSDIALDKFKEGYNCAQSMLYSFAEELNIDKDLALKIVNGFGGGMARTQEVCGAVTGGICVLSLKFGRGENDDKQQQDVNYIKIREFLSLFKKEFGSIHCRELLKGCELLTEEGQERYKRENLNEKCRMCLKSANDIVNDLIHR